MIFTCFEMRNHETLEWAYCAPEGLVNQVLEEAWRQGIEISTENALPRYDRYAYDQVNTFASLFFATWVLIQQLTRVWAYCRWGTGYTDSKDEQP